MTRAEFLAWVEFYELQPFDDYARIHKPAALIATSMSGADVGELLGWLANEKADEAFSSVDLSVMRALGVDPKKRKG